MTAGTSESWLEKAKSDLALACTLYDRCDPFPDQTAFFCQQAAEKALKAVLVHVGREALRTHAVDLLLQMISQAGVVYPLSS